MKEMRSNGFDHLSLVTAVDRKDSIDVVYHLHSMDRNEYVVVKVNTKNYVVPSVTGIWPSANWDEREQYDLVGVKFEGHPNLKRLFLPEGWIGHPLRKDYDLSKVQYVNMDEDGEDYATFDAGDGW
ncbi:NADH dehydrogenase, subunit C [mine drainage metagenome]|uniref:NADH dehydrogenase, subunit C n=1 Tax=mine drainage metagenome TaxID=410659 RepID=T0YPG2_9ZZZZ